MRSTAKGTFEIEMTPGEPELAGVVSRFTFTKRFHGDVDGDGVGVMLSCGDPQAGDAGYVAIETVRGRIDDRQGGFALQQLGAMQGGSPTLHYQVVPGSGTGGLAGIVGSLRLTVDVDGTHRYELDFAL